MANRPRTGTSYAAFAETDKSGVCAIDPGAE
jgi:hypothetical protein